MNDIKHEILIRVNDLVKDFVYYDRKEDENLPVGEIEKAIKEGTVTIKEILDAFSKALKEEIED